MQFLGTNTTSLSLVQLVGPASEEERSPGVNRMNPHRCRALKCLVEKGEEEGMVF